MVDQNKGKIISFGIIIFIFDYIQKVNFDGKYNFPVSTNFEIDEKNTRNILLGESSQLILRIYWSKKCPFKCFFFSKSLRTILIKKLFDIFQ